VFQDSHEIYNQCNLLRGTNRKFYGQNSSSLIFFTKSSQDSVPLCLQSAVRVIDVFIVTSISIDES